MNQARSPLSRNSKLAKHPLRIIGLSQAANGIVKRFNELIGVRADIHVIGPAEAIDMTVDELLEGLGNMFGGDPEWRRP